MYTKTHGRTSASGVSAHSTRSRFGAPKRKSFGSKSPRRSFGGRERIDHSRFIKKAEPAHEKKVYVPKHTFADFAFPKVLAENVVRKGYVTPMPIQDETIPFVREGRDIFGLANTGTGKTAAFLLPLLEKVLANKREKVLILAPTRELAMQIEKELIELARGLSIWSAACVGGMPISRQISTIRRGVSFVIGTPGRVKDLIDRKVLDFSTTRFVVLDEADRMLDMGFRDDMEFILGKTSKTRQTLFFSATMSPDIKQLSQKLLQNPLFISVVTGDTSKQVDQNIIRIEHKDRQVDQLHDVLIKEKDAKVLIFREMKRDVDKLAKELGARGFQVGSIHGDKRNRDRIRTLDSFKRNQVSILIATDVAARGLDIPDVTHVINYDIPQSYDTYVHRIGRTGRGGKTGKALTFVR